MKTFLTILIITFFITPVHAGELDHKGVICASMSAGFRFESQERVIEYYIKGYEVEISPNEYSLEGPSSVVWYESPICDWRCRLDRETLELFDGKSYHDCAIEQSSGTIIKKLRVLIREAKAKNKL